MKKGFLFRTLRKSKEGTGDEREPHSALVLISFLIQVLLSSQLRTNTALRSLSTSVESTNSVNEWILLHEMFAACGRVLIPLAAWRCVSGLDRHGLSSHLRNSNLEIWLHGIASFFFVSSALQCDENSRSPSPGGPGALGNSRGDAWETNDYQQQLLPAACLAHIHSSWGV